MGKQLKKGHYYWYIQGSHSLGYKKFQDFPGPQLRVWESAVSSARVVQEGTPAVKAFLAYLQPIKHT